MKKLEFDKTPLVILFAKVMSYLINMGLIAAGLGLITAVLYVFFLVFQSAGWF